MEVVGGLIQIAKFCAGVVKGYHGNNEDIKTLGSRLVALNTILPDAEALTDKKYSECMFQLYDVVKEVQILVRDLDDSKKFDLMISVSDNANKIKGLNTKLNDSIQILHMAISVTSLAAQKQQTILAAQKEMTDISDIPVGASTHAADPYAHPHSHTERPHAAEMMQIQAPGQYSRNPDQRNLTWCSDCNADGRTALKWNTSSYVCCVMSSACYFLPMLCCFPKDKVFICNNGHKKIIGEYKGPAC